MNLLFISTQVSPPWGGGEELWSDTVLHALAIGHQVAVWVSERPEKHPKLIQLEENGATVHYWPTRAPTPSLPRKVARRLGMARESVAWSKSRWEACHAALPFVPDTICVSQGGTYCAIQTEGLAGWLLEQPFPFLLLCHSNRVGTRVNTEARKITRKLFCRAQAICFVAQANLDSARRFLTTDLSHACVVQNPVNLADQSLVGWPDATVPSFATVARLNTRDKGQDLLIDAFARPEWRNRDYCLNLYGTGTDLEYLSELIVHHRIQDRVHLRGHVDDIRGIWASNHLLVLPSISEGTPITLIEAQLCGRPALVTRVDGNPEWVAEGESGFVAEAPTVQHLSNALECAWQARDRWQEMGMTARTKCLAKRDPDPAGSLLKLLETASDAGTSDGD